MFQSFFARRREAAIKRERIEELRYKRARLMVEFRSCKRQKLKLKLLCAISDINSEIKKNLDQ